MDAGLCRLNRIVLVVNGARRASEIVDLARLHIERGSHVVSHHLEGGIADQWGDVALRTGEEIVNAKNLAAALITAQGTATTTVRDAVGALMYQARPTATISSKHHGPFATSIL